MRGAEQAQMLCAQCLLVQAHRQGLCCSWGSQSPSGHTPRNFSSVLDIWSCHLQKSLQQGSLSLDSWVSMHGGSPDIQTHAGSSAGPAALGLWFNPIQEQCQELHRRDEMM